MSSTDSAKAPVAEETDALALINSYRRHAMLFVIVAVVVAVLVSVVLIVQRKNYTAGAALLMIADSQVDAQPISPGQQPQKPVSDAALSSYVDTQVEVLKSRDLASIVVKDLKLTDDPAYVPAKMLVGKPTADDLADIRETAITSVMNHLKVRRAGETYDVNVDFTSHDPDKSARIANYFATAFIRQQRQIKINAVQSAGSLVDAQLASLKADVQRDSKALADYKAEHNLVSTSAEGATLSEQQITGLTTELATQRSSEAEADARYRTAQSQVAHGSNGDDVADALNSVVVQDLRKQRAEVSARLADMEGRLGPRHPDLINTRSQLTDIDAQIHKEIERILSNLHAQADIEHDRTASLEGSLGAANGQLKATNAASVGEDELQRNFDTSKTLYESYLAKAKETQTQQSVTQPDAQVSSVAQPPVKPSSPIIPLDILIGIVLGMGAGVGAVVIRRMMDSTLRTQDDVESRLGLPYLAGIPTAVSSIKKLENEAPIDAAVSHPLSGFAEAFRSLNAAVTRSGQSVKVMAITSSLPNEGKTTTTICLGKILSLGGARTLVIDCDLRRRNMGATIGMPAPPAGLLDVLAGKSTIRDAVHVDERSQLNFLLLPRGATASAKSPLDTPEFDKLLSDAREQYDQVLLDFPPLLPIVDGRVLAPRADAVVLLCRWQQTPKRAVQHAIRLLQDVGVEPAGVALTMIDLKAQQRYGYGDAGYYYSGYSDYYLEGKT